MITTADALEVMTIVAACHHRTAPRMDDREVVLATAGTWADLFNVHDLSLSDLIAGVKKRAVSAVDAPEPAEIIQFARDIRRDRDARTGPTDHYRDVCDAKAGDAEALARIQARTGQKALGRNVPRDAA